MYKKFKLQKSEEGQSLVEFALVLPVLLMFLLGIIEFGWLFNAQISMTSAAREGARILAIQNINCTFDETAASAARTAISGAITDNTDHLTFQTGLTIDPSIVNSGSISLGKVTVKGNVKNIVGFFMGDFVNLEGEASMRLENYKP